MLPLELGYPTHLNADREREREGGGGEREREEEVRREEKRGDTM